MNFITFYCASISILLILFFYIDIYPYIKRKLSRLKPKFPQDLKDKFEEKIYKSALRMAKANKVSMTLKGHDNFISEIGKILVSTKQKKDWKFNFPKAFILWGLTEYLTYKKHNKSIEKEVIIAFDKYITTDGLPLFDLSKVVHVPFGMVAANLYILTQNIRYKNFCYYVYNTLLKLHHKDGMIKYFSSGMHSDIQYVDGLGMVIPFLVKFYEIFDEKQAIEIAKQEMDYFIINGLDRYHLPLHNINIKAQIALGPNNWGRGIGWYILGLLPLLAVDKKYKIEAIYLAETLNKLKIPEKEYWSQFPGTSKNFDASATLPIMLLFASLYPEKYSVNELFNLLHPYTLKSGSITSSSGDTWGINLYSNTFSESEFSQAILLLLFVQVERSKGDNES